MEDAETLEAQVDEGTVQTQEPPAGDPPQTTEGEPQAQESAPSEPELYKLPAGVDARNVRLPDGSKYATVGAVLDAQNEAIAALERARELPAMRSAFADATECLVTVLDSFAVARPAQFEVECPMALDGGARWLSPAREVRNPYFGDEMLGCGTVLRELAAEEEPER